MYEELKKRFTSYALSFTDGKNIPDIVRRKIDHTFDVCGISDEITAKEHIFDSERSIFLAWNTALFHDISRFEQYMKYHTLNDRASFDHGARSAEVIMTGEFPASHLTEGEKEIVCGAILHHNKKSLDASKISAETLKYAKLIRDADKLSIIKVLTAFFSDPGAFLDEGMTIDTPDTPSFTMKRALDALAGKQIDHRDMRNMNDFKITVAAWAPDINFASSADYALRHSLYGNFRRFLPESEIIDKLFSATERRLEEKAAGGI